MYKHFPQDRRRNNAITKTLYRQTKHPLRYLLPPDKASHSDLRVATDAADAGFTMSVDVIPRHKVTVR